MAVAADDHVVVHHHAERGCGFFDVLGYGDVGFGRGRVARGVVVHQDQGGRLELERPFDDFAGINRRMIDRPALLPLVPDQDVLTVEKQDMEFLDFAVRYVRGAVIDQLVP